MSEPTRTPPTTPFDRLRSMLRLLYHGQSPMAVRFQFSVIALDLLIIAFFIASPIVRDERWYLWVDLAIAGLLFLDLLARALASNHFWLWLRQLPVLIDVVILMTLLVPSLFFNFGFLRILRLWTLSRKAVVWRQLGRWGLKPYEQPIRAVLNLLVFLFVVTSYVYTAFAGRDSGISGYVDALYFTVATVTTTGFGDVTLPGTAGKLTSILIMIAGISLFVRLAQSVFRPSKVFFPCPQCGLSRHEPDAVHCKACGHILNIPDEGNH